MTRIVVLRALGLGDLLTAVPALRGLRRGYPNAELLLAAPAGLAPLVALIGAVDAVVDTGPFLTAPPTGTLDARLAHPDLAVNLHGRGPQSTALLAATLPLRLVAYGVTAAWVDDEPEVARWCRLVTAAGAAADPADLTLAVPDAPSPAPGAVVVHPGAAHGARRWPVARWTAVARALAAAGERVVVTGTAVERELAMDVAAGAGLAAEAVLAGRTGLVDLAALVAQARLVLCGDTGISHLASAYATPSVQLFGPTSPARWGPPALAQHRVLWAGSTGDPLAETPFPGLLAIEVAEVVDAATSLLGSSPARMGG